MANNGTYGTKKPAFITSSDVEIFYTYRPNRNTDSSEFSGFVQLDSDILSTVDATDNVGNSLGTLPGVYNIKLPLDKFGRKGIYTIYIRPREINATILDVSTLAAFPNIRGIVFNSSNVTNNNDSTIFNNGGLVGYRVEYFDENGERMQEYRLITSSNRCEPVAQNMNDSSQKGIRYNFNVSSNLIFCTLTPSTAMSFNSNNTPFIGNVNQRIKLINTKFNPVMMEIEMVDHDIETVSTMLEGDQIRNLDKGLITTFDSDGNIYHQASYGHMVNKQTGLNVDFKLANDETTVYLDEEDKLDEVKNNQ